MTNERNAVCTIPLSGRVDSANAAAVERDIAEKRAGHTGPVVLDAADLTYISSAGLRVILRLKKTCPDLAVVNVSPDVYDIFDVTGFTEMMRVERAYRTVSVEGCEVIGEGYNGKVYRIDRDTVIKTYKNAEAPDDIRRERELAKLALVLGVPTAISYDVVRVGDGYGSVFELLDARSFSDILAKEPEKMDLCVAEYVAILKKLHAIHAPAGKLPSIRQKTLSAVARTAAHLPEELGRKLMKMAEAIPESDCLVHGDCHTKNVMWAGGETLLIDMDTLSVGHPVFEFLHMYNAYRGYSEYDPGEILRFQGYDQATADRFWHKTLVAYFGTNDEAKINAVEDKIRCLSYAYLYDWKCLFPSGDARRDEAERGLWFSRLLPLLERVDTLTFDVPVPERADELTVAAKEECLPEVTDFIGERLQKAGCPPKTVMQIDLAVEEVFVNIAHYAYAPGTGDVTVRALCAPDEKTLTLTFIDGGRPYDPLSKADPDVTLTADEREIGGLGIFLTKKVMDGVDYAFENGHNVLTLQKKW